MSIKERIAEVLREHRQQSDEDGPLDECECGWYQSNEDDDCWWREHIASVLVAELGLTQDVQSLVPISVPDFNDDGSPAMDERWLPPIHKHHFEWGSQQRYGSTSVSAKRLRSCQRDWNEKGSPND